MDTMEWTDVKPTRPGWYWVYEDFGPAYAIEIVQVICHAHEDRYVLSSEYDGRVEIDRYRYWLGPIDLPKPPAF